MQFEESTERDSPPRILHLIHGLGFGGIEKWLLAALQHMPRDEFAMDICYKGPREGDLAPLARATGAQFLHCPLGPTVFPFIRRLKAILRSGSYSLLHVHTGVHSGPAVFAAKSVGMPVAVTFHNSRMPPQTSFTQLPGVRHARERYARRSIRYALLNASVGNGVSMAAAEAVTEMARLPLSRCEVMYLGCPRPQPISPECKAAYRNSLQLPHDARVIIHVGRHQAEKNFTGLLQVFRRVADAMPNIALLLAGDGPLRPVIEGQIRDLGLEQQVRLLGVRHDVIALMQFAEVFLFPSHHEGLSIAMMEAAAVGLPIVASDVPGNREATSGGSARLHNVSDVEGMASSVMDLLQNPAERKRLVDLGREVYERTFSIEASANRLVKLYRSVLRTNSNDYLASRISA